MKDNIKDHVYEMYVKNKEKAYVIFLHGFYLGIIISSLVFIALLIIRS